MVNASPEESVEKIQQKILALQTELEEIYIRLDAIRQEEGLLQRFESEYSLAKATLQGFKDIEANEEALIPIGGGVYIKARITDVSRVLVNIGAETFVEYDNSEALKKLDEALEKIQKRRQDLAELSRKLSKRAEEIRQELVKLGEAARKG
ncbi:MAG: prefoldin subunit alpha [Thermoplasmata archaeon]|nr:prefoldin subunit alpha [Euryarchaeota archaeon]RLF65818.1 MAG: prefoldin subunit alpha [Thermoplasmata archaeon]